jgi:hypothetical protein
MGMSSRTRLSEYTSLFMVVDEARVNFVKEMVTKTIDNIDKNDTEEIEIEVDMVMNKVVFLNEIAEVIINSIIENAELTNGN